MAVEKRPWRVKKIFYVAFLLVPILLVGRAARHSNLVEHYYSQGAYQFICALLHPLFNVFPFSVGDLWYLLLVVLIFIVSFQLVRLAWLKRFSDAGRLLMSAAISSEVLILAFYILWGMNYFRPPAAIRLNLTDSVYSKAELISVTAMLIDSANASRDAVSPLAWKQGDEVLLTKSIKAVHGLAEARDEFKIYKPNVKVSLLSTPISYLGTAGYYNPFTTEAQINGRMPVWLKPLTACHEMAHQMGFNREDEANFVGFLAAIRSGDPLLKYSAYYMAVEEFMFDVMVRDSTSYQNLRDRISVPVLDDFKADRDFWLNYRGTAGTLSSIFYDNYLKLNNQPEGLRTYNRMIKLTMAWYKEKRKIAPSLQERQN